MKRYTTPEVAKLLGICKQRVHRKLKDGHFPHAALCECGRTTLIPKKDIDKNKDAQNGK